MRSVRVVCSFAVLSFAALMIALVAAQLAAQTLPVGFKAATAYPSGGYGNSSLAVADVNGDGYPDLIVAHASCHDCSSGEVSVLLGKGDGTFQAPVSYSSGGYGADSVAVADVNGDGHLDIVVVNYCQNS